MTALSLGTITQGERGTLSFTWTFPVASPATIQGATITAVMTNIDTGAVTAVTGTLTGTAAATCTWALSAADSGTAGTFSVIFLAVVSGVDTYTLAAYLAIKANPSVTAVAGPSVVGISQTLATWLGNAYTAIIAIAAGYLLKTDGTNLVDSGILATDVSTAITNAAKAEFVIACSDETTALTTGTAKVTFRMPFAMTLTAVRASVTTAPTGSTLVVDINESGTTVLSTKLSIDATETTSTTAATPAVISDSALADDAQITIDIDQIGSSVAGAGLKVALIGTRV